MDFGPVLVIVVIIIGILLVTYMGRSGPKGKKPTSKSRPQSTMTVQQFQSSWKSVEELLERPGTDATKSAIFEADKLLDMALRRQGFEGETMGERLKSARNHFQNQHIYQGLWEAHKVRNALAHELSFELPKVVAQHHLQQFKAGLDYLKVL